MAYVKIYFGPYEAHGIIRHRPERLRGVLVADYLNEKYYEVELVPVDWLNQVKVEMKGELIFTCDIRNLSFYMDYEEDPVAQRMILAIEEGTSRMYCEENIPSFFVPRPSMGRLFTKPPRTTLEFLNDSQVELFFEIDQATDPSESENSDTSLHFEFTPEEPSDEKLPLPIAKRFSKQHVEDGSK